VSQRALRLLAVDDERPALEDLARMLRSAPGVSRVEMVLSGSEALRALSAQPFDALFIDVRMPDLNGIELARVLRRFDRPPPVVFVSAYQTGAVDAFEVEALDYLMKPVARADLERALARVTAALERNGDFSDRAEADIVATEPPGAATQDDVVPVDTTRGGTRLLERRSVLYLQAQGDYVRIVSDDGRFLLRAKISAIEPAWELHGFVRIHRSFIANLRRAIEVRPHVNGTATLVLSGGVELPIARRKVGPLRARLRI
jgi:DNA-binding LytR/AlgR family response regulator